MFSESSLIIGRDIFLEIFEKSDQKWSVIFLLLLLLTIRVAFFIYCYFNSKSKNKSSPLVVFPIFDGLLLISSNYIEDPGLDIT